MRSFRPSGRAPGPDLADRDVGWLVRRSVEVIRGSQHAGGAYVASPDFPPYRFCWLRDGSFAADAMSRAGETASAEAFFGWCAAVVEARAGTVAPLVERHREGDAIGRSEHLPCRYTVDGDDDTGAWPTFQLDGYGMWLWAVDAHIRRHGRDPAPWRGGLESALRYLAAFATVPCFDWWEERWGVHTATLAAVRAGLAAGAAWPFVAPDVRARAAAAARRLAACVRAECIRGGRLAAEVGGGRLDASLVACATPFRLLAPDDPAMEATVAALEVDLAHGGVHRYAGDSFYGGGEWLPLAGLLGLWYAAVGRTADARAQLAWIASQARRGGELPEQVHAHLLEPAGWDEWVGRWGPPATPLVWSHAAFLTLALELRDPSGGWG